MPTILRLTEHGTSKKKNSHSLFICIAWKVYKSRFVITASQSCDRTELLRLNICWRNFNSREFWGELPINLLINICRLLYIVPAQPFQFTCTRKIKRFLVVIAILNQIKYLVIPTYLPYSCSLCSNMYQLTISF